MITHCKQILLFATMIMLTGVAMGTFGAHCFNFNEYHKGIYKTALEYQFIHGLALLALGIYCQHKNQLLKGVFYFFTTGIFLFSGSLYLLAITEIKKFGMITPIGGILFIIAWGLWFGHLLKSKNHLPTN